MRVSLLRYIVVFPVLPACPGALKSERPPLPRQEAAFLGGPEWGSQNRNGVVRRSRSFEERRARGIWPEAVPRTEGQIRIMTFLDAPLQGFVGVDENHDQT